jgi:hypothetical protein
MNRQKSDLRGALQRIGSQLRDVEEVVGLFTPTAVDPDGQRIYGTLETHDARVAVGFDKRRVALPPEGQRLLSVTGKPWVDGKTSRITLMVSRYVVVDGKGAGSVTC